MPQHKPCDAFQDELLGLKSPSQEMGVHIQQCPECREILAAGRRIRDQGSLFEDPRNASVKRKIMDHYGAFHGARIPWFADFSFKWAWGAIAAAVCLILMITSFVTSTRVPGKKDAIYRCIQNGRTLEVALSTPVELSSGSSVVLAPDGSRFEVEGKTLCRVFERGFNLTHGKITATVVPSVIPFKAATPHGEIEVLGTVFSCVVDEKDSLVKVISGRVKVTPTGRPSQTLVDGLSMSMVNYPPRKENLPGSAVHYNGSGSLHPNDD